MTSLSSGIILYLGFLCRITVLLYNKQRGYLHPQNEQEGELIMNILCATDDNYASYCAVMLTSLFENNAKNCGGGIYHVLFSL